MTKKKEDPNHHQGKMTGYTLIDGAYHIAPIYQEQFNQIQDEAAGIDQLIRSVNESVQKMYKENRRKIRELWDDLHEDLGLDKDKKYFYHPYTHAIEEVKERKD